MGGFRHGGPLMGYQDGGNLIAKIGQYIGKIANTKVPAPLGGHGLGALLAFALMPDKLGAGQDEKLRQMRAQTAYQNMMDEQHGEGWSFGPVPTVNRGTSGLRIDPSQVRKQR
jgi:hypothetical protein